MELALSQVRGTVEKKGSTNLICLGCFVWQVRTLFPEHRKQLRNTYLTVDPPHPMVMLHERAPRLLDAKRSASANDEDH